MKTLAFTSAACTSRWASTCTPPSWTSSASISSRLASLLQPQPQPLHSHSLYLHLHRVRLLPHLSELDVQRKAVEQERTPGILDFGAYFAFRRHLFGLMEIVMRSGSCRLRVEEDPLVVSLYYSGFVWVRLLAPSSSLAPTVLHTSQVQTKTVASV